MMQITVSITFIRESVIRCLTPESTFFLAMQKPVAGLVAKGCSDLQNMCDKFGLIAETKLSFINHRIFLQKQNICQMIAFLCISYK